MTSNQWFLMCPPTYFGVEYEINVHMKMDNPVDPSLAMEQWESLVRLIKSFGAGVDVMMAQPECPDLVFTANAGLIHDGRIALSNFANRERRVEQPHWARHFNRRSRLSLPSQIAFEGAGDSFIHNKTLYLGTGFRSSARAVWELVHFFRPEKALICALVDPRFYHLDTAFCPLDDKTIMYYPGAFGAETQESLLETTSIWVPEDEAARFACNAVVVGRNVITPTGCPKTGEMLERAGFIHHERDMSEFMKAGGACKCLTLALDS